MWSCSAHSVNCCSNRWEVNDAQTALGEGWPKVQYTDSLSIDTVATSRWDWVSVRAWMRSRLPSITATKKGPDYASRRKSHGGGRSIVFPGAACGIVKPLRPGGN